MIQTRWEHVADPTKGTAGSDHLMACLDGSWEEVFWLRTPSADPAILAGQKTWIEDYVARDLAERMAEAGSEGAR